MPNSGRKWDSLITAETSLIARFNSLQDRKKFPARMRRELARKKLISCPFSLLLRRRQAPNRRNSLYFPFRDEFAADSSLQRRVMCEPDSSIRAPNNARFRAAFSARSAESRRARPQR